MLLPRGGRKLHRGAVGLAILGLYGALTPPLQYLTLVGLVPLGTALTGFCPVVAWLDRHRAAPDATDAGGMP